VGRHLAAFIRRLTIAARLNQSLHLSNTLADALHALLEVVDAEFGAIHAIHDSQAVLRAAHGLSDAEARRLPGPYAYGRWYSSDLAIVREAVDDTRGQIDGLLKAAGIQVVVTVPLRERGELTGLLTLATRSIDKFEAEEITFISTAAEQISAAMTNARLFEEARHRAEELSILYDVSHMLRRR
jgi:GAF domain-containing protein